MPNESTNSRQSPDAEHANKRAIPRFASFFKPNPSSEAQSQGIKASEKTHRLLKDLEGAPEESKSKSHKRAPSQQLLQGQHKRSLKRDPDSDFRSESTRQDSNPCENVSKSFIVDRRGDVRNLEFGSLHATVSYSRYGAGNVVGLPKNQKIDRAVSTDKDLVLSDHTHGLPKNGGNHTRWKLDQQGAKELRIKPCEVHELNINSAPETADYVSLELAQRAKKRQGDDALRSGFTSPSDDNDTHYRTVEGKAKSQKEPADQDLEYNSDTSSSQDIAGSPLDTLNELARRKHTQLSRRIDAEPTDFEAWIQLITHQDNMLGFSQGSARSSQTKAERCSIAEIKLAMFEKALDQVKDSHGRESLLLGMMQEATRIWERDKILSHWKIILEQNSRSLRLWTKYLDFMQTSFTRFRFGEVRSVYTDCLNIIQGARSSGGISPNERSNIFEIQIYVVLRMSLFMRESGFAEHATAAWQALLEFVFFRPAIVQSGDHEKNRLSNEATVSMFEQFWDSEVPRIGEEGAEGWARFLQKQGRPPQPSIEIADDLKYEKDFWKSWLASERRRSLLSRNPARATDDLEVNDPYSIILFSDIRPFLLDPPSAAGQQLILDAFLAFCCLPPFTAEAPDSCSRVWRRDRFLNNDALRLSTKLQELWRLRSCKMHGSLEEHDSMDKDPLLTPVRDYQISSDSLFAGKHWFSAFDTWQEQCSGDDGPVEAAWVLRSLKSLFYIRVEEEAVASYILALELRISPETVKRTAKNFLRRRPLSISLYNAYALIEYRLAGSTKGEGIITTSIKMGKKLDEVSQRDIILLWRTWIWETLSGNSTRDALVRLLAFGDEEIQMSLPRLDHLGSAEPALLLRTERVNYVLPSNGLYLHPTGSR